MDSTTAALASWAATVSRERLLVATDHTIAAIRDVMGCMLAGQAEPEPQIIARSVARWGTGVARILGTPTTAAPPFAALVNGAAAHILDFDDSFVPLTGHACATIVPAAIATAEECGASGADLVDAVTVALEITGRIAAAVNPRHYALGWHSTATIGAIGSAVGAARLRHLPPELMVNAISLAVSQSAGTRMQLGTQAKCAQAGLASQAGVIAATLAAEGLSATPEALRGPWRFVDLYGGPDVPIVPPGPQEKLAIISPGMIFKPYPTCGSTHRSIDAVLALRASHGFTPDQIERIEFIIPAVNANNLMYPDPETGMQARFSMQYCAAVAASAGAVVPADFSAAAIHRPAIRAVMPRVEMLTLPGSEETALDYLELPAHTTIRLRDGTTLRDTRYVRSGSPDFPMTLAEQHAKFVGCASAFLPAPAVSQALSCIDNLLDLPQVSDLTQLLAVS